LDERGYLELKAVLSDINNILTMKVTLAFIHWLASEMEFSDAVKESLIENVLSTKPSTNGYDIEMATPSRLVAEVKCNVPINGGVKYCSAQRNRIVKAFRCPDQWKNQVHCNAV
jgi:hypothetical protein